MININEIVKDMLEQHIGGEVFFDNLDKNMRDIDIANMFYDKIAFSSFEFDRIVLSGKFGIFFYNYIAQYNQEFLVKYSPLLIRGGLRHDTMNGELEYLSHSIYGKKFLFIDDSFYSGHTRDAINEEIKRCCGEIVGTYVIYDGSKEKDKTVKSLYRYYDNYKGDA